MKTTSAQKVHFMGIGGSGASAVAQIAKAYGFEVSGCDLEAGRNTHYLEKSGIKVVFGHDKSHLKGVDFLAHTPAVFFQSENHPEYVEASKKKISLTWEQFLGQHLQKGKFVVAVAGTHGKGTTSALLSRILEKANFDPTVEIGANLLDWDRKNYRIGQSDYFVCEADEYNNNFLDYKAQLVLITSIEMDHPDFFKDLDAVFDSFEKFVKKMVGQKILVLNKDDSGCKLFAKRIEKYFDGKIVWYSGEYKGKLQLPGKHMRQDAQGAAVAAKALGVGTKDIESGLASFGGLERRYEYKGEIDGVKVFDDYAHHPTAVSVNISAMREQFPKKKIWVVFQPHMYSRLSTLFNEFRDALSEADRVVVMDVYTRREHGITTPSGKDLATAIPDFKATYVGGGIENVVNFVRRNTDKNDVVVVMGAGDSYRVAEELVR